MKVVLSPRAARDLDAQLQYLIDQHAVKAAADLEALVSHFLLKTLVSTPRIGLYDAQHNLYETWIPRTKLVIWYRIEHEHIVIARFWHTSQNWKANP
jgi:plasmid stabilization system protein ParE